MSNNHPIIAQPWQLKSNLSAVLMPLLPEPLHGEKPDSTQLLMAMKWQVGDRIYLQEEWLEHDDGYAIKSLWKESSEYSDDSEWNPAHTMPSEAAQFWYEITSVEVTQAKALDMPTLIESKLTYWGDLREDPRLLESEVVHYWNKCHPEHPWYGDRHVVILRLRFCSPKD